MPLHVICKWVFWSIIDIYPDNMGILTEGVIKKRRFVKLYWPESEKINFKFSSDTRKRENSLIYYWKTGLKIKSDTQK